MGGVLLAYQRQSLSVQSYQVFLSLSIVALAYLAGITSIAGALLAGALAPEGLVSALSGSDVYKRQVQASLCSRRRAFPTWVASR